MTTVTTEKSLKLSENEELFGELCDVSGDEDFAMEFLLASVSPDLIRDLIRQVKERMED